jgi:hypothetical protein
MHPILRTAVLVALACGSGLAGCSRDNAAAGSAVAGSAATHGPTNDPCTLVTDGEMGKAFAGARAGKRDHSLDKYGIATCTWESPANTIVAQIFAAKGSAADEVRGRMDGYIDPVKPGAGDQVRYVTIAGLGDEATASAVKADAAQGILSDGAVLGVRRGERMAVLFTHNLVDGDTAATIAALQEVGLSAAARL